MGIKEKKLIHRTIRRVGERRRKNKSVVALIPARGGSKGVKRKNIQIIAGYPMLAHSIMALKAAGIRNIWISTEDEEIAGIARTYGAKVMERPEELAGDYTPTEDVIAHFFENVSCDVLVMIQCTSPMLQPKNIIDGLNKLYACGLDSVFSAVKANDMLIWDMNICPINYNPKCRKMRQKQKRYLYIESGGFYIFTRRMFLKYRCRIGGRHDISEVPFWQSFQIDNKHDLQMVRKLMEKQ